MSALRIVRDRAGVTLVELLVVLAVLGVMAGVAGLAARSLDDTTPAAERAAMIARARSAALRGRRPVSLTIGAGDSARVMTVLPDGTVRADSALGLDLLTGRPRAVRRTR
ncbi:MAG TPA: prepilin-type N-terminal cleavage/methylation domain-containing protein [Longimicrobium sp.]|nr:prepilin-type N-terminal cleavage/methylation domain-containing protein [Longimicrobium sp.]